MWLCLLRVGAAWHVVEVQARDAPDARDRALKSATGLLVSEVHVVPPGEVTTFVERKEWVVK